MISDKYKYYINCDKYRFEFLEGSTASGKTTVAVSWKFIPKVLKSDKKLHVLFGKTTGVIEKNIIQQDNGILYYWGQVFKYYGNGTRDFKFPHLIGVDGCGREKIILLVGYDNKSSWLNILGGQYGCVFIDEINTAHIDVVREVSSRCDWLCGTLNPDNPDLDIYTEYINKAVIDEQYGMDVPDQIRGYMQGTKSDWGYFFFNMNDNVSLSEEAKQRKRESLDPATKIYKNKILGLRVRAVGLVFPHYERAIIEDVDVNSLGCSVVKKTLGVDTSYSALTDDMVAMVEGWLLSDGRWIAVKSWGDNNKDRRARGEGELSPSDVARWILDICAERGIREVYVDSADQGTILEARKLVGGASGVQIIGAYKQTTIIDRINLMSGWMWQQRMLIVAGTGVIREFSVYSWQEGKDIPEDANDHYINAMQYGWLPYKESIR